MASAEDIKDAIAENATGPRRARGDEGEIEQHPIKDQIEAARFVAGHEAAQTPARGLRFTKLVFPGTSS